MLAKNLTMCNNINVSRNFTKGGNMKNKFYYRWGNEKFGYVTTWELITGEVKNTKEEPRDIVEKQNLKYDCPYS